MKIWTVSPPDSSSSWAHLSWVLLREIGKSLELVTHQPGSSEEVLVVLRLTSLTTFTNPLTSSNLFNLGEMRRQQAEQRASFQMTSCPARGSLQDLKCWYLNYHIALQMLEAWPMGSAALKLVHSTLLGSMCLFAIRNEHNLFKSCHNFGRGQLQVV